MKGRVWNLIQWQELWIHLTKFDAATRKLNRQCDIQLAVTKTRFFPWYVAMKCDTHNGNSTFGDDSASQPHFSYATWLYHVWHQHDTSVVDGCCKKGRYQFIISFWDFVSILSCPSLFKYVMESIVNSSFRHKTVFHSLPAVDPETLPIY